MNPELPRQIGRIRIEGSLGKGGMGEVFVGFDETLERRVALKAIRDERRVDPESRARFQREARVLSRLDHPGICRLYDYVEGDEADYLVLELIEGESLKDVLDHDELTWDFKLYVAEMIADALRAAHAQGIAHRDLKPENVMLTESGEVKLLDFGLASWMTGPGTVSGEPLDGGPLDGGPLEDGSPEGEPSEGQSREERAPTESPATNPEVAATPTTDAVGVPDGVVSESKPGAFTEADFERPTVLLSDPPFQGPMAPVAEVSPSSAPVLVTEAGAVMGTVAYMSPEQARGERVTVASDLYSFGLLLQELFTGLPAQPRDATVLQLLVRASQGETEPVAGLDPDLAQLVSDLCSLAPEDRPTAPQVIDRLRAIESKPRRRRRRLLMALVVLALLAVALKYTLDLRQERTAALEARREAEQVSDFLVGLFSVSDPGTARGRTVTARELLDAGAQRIGRDLAGQPLAQSRLMASIGRVYRQLGLYDEARPLLEEALAIRRARFGDNSPEIVASLDHLANLYHDQGRFGLAEPLYLRALEIREAELGPEHPNVAASLNNLAFLYRARGDNERAEPLLRRALDLYRQHHEGPHPDVARALNNLGDLERARGRLPEAVVLLEEALEVQRRLLGNSHPEVAVALNNLAMTRFQQGELVEAEGLYHQMLTLLETVLGPEHPNVATALNNLAELHRARGGFAAAEPFYLRAAAIQESSLGVGHPSLAVTLDNLAQLQAARGEWNIARKTFDRAIAIQEQSLGPLAPELALTLHHRADLEATVGDPSAAEPFYRRALEIQERSLAAAHPSLVATGAGLASVLLDQQRLVEAATLLDLFLGVDPGSAASPAERRPWVELGWVEGRRRQAVGDSDRAQAIWQAALDKLDSTSPAVAERRLQALLLVELGRTDEARDVAREFLDLGLDDPRLSGIATPK